MAAHHGAATIGHVHILTMRCCRERAPSGGGGVVVSGRGTPVRTKTTTAMTTRSAAFACPSEAAMSSSSTCCRMQRMAISNISKNRRSRSKRQEALRSRQWDVGVGGEADAMGVEDDEEEPMGSFWDRLQRAWRVLIGTPSGEARATRTRFSRLLVRDRGFTSSNLSTLYNVAKGAIKEHVELEGDEDVKVTAVVDRLGELRLDFRVKRVKSVLMDEPFSHSVLPDIDPNLSVSRDDLWEDNRASQDTEFRVREATSLDPALPTLEPSLSNSGNELSEYSRVPLDFRARLEVALNRPALKFVVPDVEPSLATSGDQLWEDSTASQDLDFHVGGESDPFPNVVSPDVEQSLSISADQLWDDNRAQQDLEVDREGASIIKSINSGGAVDDPVSNSVLADVEPRLSISVDKVWQDSRALQDLKEDVEGAFNFSSTTDVDSDGEWYTFSFAGAKVELGIGKANVDGDLGKQL